MFARRLPPEERPTKQVVVAIEEISEPPGVAVVIESPQCTLVHGHERCREDDGYHNHGFYAEVL